LIENNQAAWENTATCIQFSWLKDDVIISPRKHIHISLNIVEKPNAIHVYYIDENCLLNHTNENQPNANKVVLFSTSLRKSYCVYFYVKRQ
jgi:hypothetical protein